MRRSDYVPGLRVSLVREPSAVACPPAEAAGPREAAALVRSFIPAGDEREHFVAVLLDNRRRVKGVVTVSIGTLTASLVHPREVFRPAIVAGAAGIVVAHNHPSGDCRPSQEDRAATRRLKEAGDLLGIPLLDHVVIGGGDGAFYSFREEGAL